MYNIVYTMYNKYNKCLCSHTLYTVQYELTFSAGYVVQKMFEFFMPNYLWLSFHEFHILLKRFSEAFIMILVHFYLMSSKIFIYL